MIRSLTGTALLACAMLCGPGVAAAADAAGPTQPVPAPGFPGQRVFGRIAFDRYSLIIDGRRTLIWSGEIHPFRLPSPDLWRDVLQKMKAIGFNTVSVYFDWGYHSPRQGSYDFTGIRDMDLVLRMAAEEGLYVIARPGPYVNAELSRGGFPGWLVNQRARARTDDPEYLAAVDEWMAQMNRIIARHQLNNGGGSVILHQIENELALTTPAQGRYLEHLYRQARAAGITVPIFHNDQGRNGYWVPKGSNVPGTVEGPSDLYAFDGYPGGTCTVEGRVTRNVAAPDYGSYGVGGARGGATASPFTPGFAAEYGGGWFDYWGSNGGYECNALQRGRGFQRVFYGANLANGVTLQNFYLAYGGTSWGWLPAPVVYTSYDYGAAISETRALRPKADELKQLGQLVQAVPDLARMERATGVTSSSPRIRVYHNRNPDTDARFLLLTHEPSNGTGNESFTLDAALPDGQYRIPMQLNGFDARWLVAGVNLERQRLAWSSSELQTTLRQGERDVILMHGRDGEPGSTVLRFARAPRVTVLAGSAESRFDAARGELQLNYRHGGLIRVVIEGTERAPLLLLIADAAASTSFWRRDLREGAVLLRGSALLRSAALQGGTLALRGDMASDDELEAWAPPAARTLRWNDQALATVRSDSGSLRTRAALPGPQPVPLPDLARMTWRVSLPSPEARGDYDDQAWLTAGAATNTSTVRPPDGQPNLAMDAHGFHSGDVWYRGRFNGDAQARRITLHYGGGGSGMLQLWLDGAPVGQHELPSGLPRPLTMGVASFALPPAAMTPGPHVLAVMIRNNGHNWDLEADDFHKEARGLVSASLDAGGRSFAVPIAWKIQGHRGGEQLADTVRGVANSGGLHGERFGWHLPVFDDSSWTQGRVPDDAAVFGTRWYRTRFTLNVPPGHDATVGIAIGDLSTPRSTRAYRALLFVNGWNMGQFIAHVGPQRVFPIPEGILDHRGNNTLALAVTSDGAPGNALEAVRLVNMRTVRGGIPVRKVETADAR